MEPCNTNSNVDNIPEPPTTPSKFDRATFLKAKLKSGAKRILGQDDNDSSSDVEQVEDVFEDAAFDPQKVLEANPHERGSLRDKIHRSAHNAAATVKNPRRAMRSKYARTVAENVSGQPMSYDKQNDRELVEAHDALERAKMRAGSTSDLNQSRSRFSSETSSSGEGGKYFSDLDGDDASSVQHDIEDARARVERVRAKRESMKTAWILGRHVKRVRVARPMLRPPTKSQFMENHSEGQEKRLRWDKYLAHVALWQTRAFTPYHIDDFDELPFDPQDLTLTIERLAIVSTPWQNFLLDVREVYLWSNPKRTLKYLAAYCVLWYLQHIMTAGFAWIIFSTVRNKIQPTQIESVRDRVERAENEHARARAWAELIQRHGKQDWIEPFLDNLGPLTQLELSDLSNLLEIFESFYRWERPGQTWSTLFFFAMCLLLSLMTDMNFCVKLFWFGVGFFFFVTLPLSARLPKYRKLLNPIYWVFWDIPNMAELAIEQLQEKAALRDEARLKRVTNGETLEEGPNFFEVSSSDDDRQTSPIPKDESTTDILQVIKDNDHAIFRAVNTETHVHGRLKLLRDGFWYYDKKLKSYHPYSELSEIRKVELSKPDDPDASKRARLARRIQESSSLQYLPSGIEFLFHTSQPNADEDGVVHDDNGDRQQQQQQQQQLALTVSESDRDRIFSLVISWSGLKWQPLFSLNARNKLSPGSDYPSKHGKGNKDFDKLIKSFVH